MKLKLFFALFVFITVLQATAQDKYYTKSGKIDFYSKAPLEDIEAANRSAVCVLDATSGSLQFSVLMKGFEFENEEMQDHFNENYLESHLYPKAEFKGQIVNNNVVNYNKQGNYPVQIKGGLTIHGVTKEVQTTGTIKVNDGGLNAVSTFNIQVTDYGIKIPAIVKDKIAKNVKISVDTKLTPLK